MEIKKLIGICVENQTYGKGKVLDVEEENIVVEFKSGIKKFIFPNSFKDGKYLKTNSKIQIEIESYIIELEKKVNEEKQAILGKKIMPIVETKCKMKPIEKQVWFKFEGSQNRNNKANLHKVQLNGKTLYVINFNNNPSIKDGDTFFMLEGIEDSHGKACQVITGRGVLCAPVKGRKVPEEWCAEYPWMKKRNVYVVIKEFEMLNTSISNCFTLENVLLNLKSDTYDATYGKNKDLDYLRNLHCRRTHMKSTTIAEEYINKKFDEYIKKFGSLKFISE